MCLGQVGNLLPHVALPATMILSITLVAAIWPALQGLLLTVAALGLFIAVMLLMPRVNASANHFWALMRAAQAPLPADLAGGG